MVTVKNPNFLYMQPAKKPADSPATARYRSIPHVQLMFAQTFSNRDLSFVIQS